MPVGLELADLSQIFTVTHGRRQLQAKWQFSSKNDNRRVVPARMWLNLTHVKLSFFLWSNSALLSHVWESVQAIFVGTLRWFHSRSSCLPLSSFNPVSSSNLHLRPSRVTGGLCILRKLTTTTGTVTLNICYCGWLLCQIKCIYSGPCKGNVVYEEIP